jgi:hypothetical protein
MSEEANYITCPVGHKVFVIWSPKLQRFGFTCDECGQHSLRAVSLHGTIEVTIVRPPAGGKV